MFACFGNKEREYNESSINNIYDRDSDLCYFLMNNADKKKNLVIGHTEGGNLDALKWMYKQNYSFDVKNNQGMTPLMIAANYGDEKIVKWLLKIGLDPMAVSPEGKNAYDIALQAGHQDIASKLLKVCKNKHPGFFKPAPVIQPTHNSDIDKDQERHLQKVKVSMVL